MEKAGLAESMEPLWHAVRADAGEELEPLPAEIMDTVKDIRREVEERRNTPWMLRGTTAPPPMEWNPTGRVCG